MFGGMDLLFLDRSGAALGATVDEVDLVYAAPQDWLAFPVHVLPTERLIAQGTMA